MGLHEFITAFGRTTISPGEEKAKQANDGWGPRRPPPGYPRHKPTVVLEVGVSESSAKLQRDVQFWLNPEQGQANLVITCKMDRKMPIIMIDTWERAENTAIRRSQHVQLSINKDSKVIKKTDDHLTISFVHLFRRQPDGPDEKDIILDEGCLEYIARTIWENQGFWEVEDDSAQSMKAPRITKTSI